MIRPDCDFCWESGNPDEARWSRRIYYLCSCEKLALTPLGRVLGFREVDEEGVVSERVRGDVNTCAACPYHKPGGGPHKMKDHPYQTP